MPGKEAQRSSRLGTLFKYACGRMALPRTELPAFPQVLLSHKLVPPMGNFRRVGYLHASPLRGRGVVDTSGQDCHGPRGGPKHRQSSHRASCLDSSDKHAPSKFPEWERRKMHHEKEVSKPDLDVVSSGGQETSIRSIVTSSLSSSPNDHWQRLPPVVGRSSRRMAYY